MFDYNTIGESPIRSQSDVNEQDALAENGLINSNSSKIIDIEGNTSIPLSATYNRFNKAGKASTRFVIKPFKKVKITSWLNFDKEKLNSYVNRNIRYRLNNSILEQVEENIFSADNKNLESQTTARIDLNDKSSLQILSNFYSGLSQKNIASTINNANFQYNLIGNTNSLNNKITYINRFNEVCALSFDFVSFNHKRNQVFGLMSNQPIKSPFIDSVNFTGIEQHLAIPMKTMGANLQLLYSKASHQFAFNSGIIGREENVLSNLNEYRIDSFQNDLLLTNKNYYLGFNWKKQFKNFAFFFKGTLGKNQSKMKNFLILNKTDTNYGTYYALPTFSVVLRKPKLQFLSTYNYNYGLPQLIDLYSGYVLTSNRTFSRGTYHYAPSNSHTLIFNYRYQDLENFDALTNFYMNSTISVRTGAYQSRHQIDDYFNIVYKELNSSINSNYSLSGGIERYFPKLLSTIKLKPSFSYLTYQNAVNNTSNRQNTYSIYSLDMTMRSGFSSIFNFAFGVKPFISQFKTIRTDFNNKIFTKNIGGYFDMYFNPSKKLNFRFENEFYTFRNSNQKNQSYFFANAYLDYRLIKSNVNIRLQCRNVLNTKSLVNNYTTDFLDTQSRIKLIPRFLLLEFDFNF